MFKKSKEAEKEKASIKTPSMDEMVQEYIKMQKRDMEMNLKRLKSSI